MQRRNVLKLAAGALAAPYVLTPAMAQTKQKVSYAYLLDPAYDAVLWAINNGKVTSDLIEIDAHGLNIPSLIQATSTNQYDVVQTAVIALPAAVARGLKVSILSAALVYRQQGEGGGIWVKKGSPIKDASELKGKKVASYGLRSTGWMYARDVLHERFGLNIALEGGDMEQIEIAAPNLPTALGAGQVDAAALIHSQAWKAQQTGDFVNICDTSRILYELHGDMVASVNIGFPARLAARPDAFKEFCRMIKASSEYALANRTEVFGAVGKATGLPLAFFDWWFDRTSTVPGTFTADHARAVEIAWKLAKDYALVPAVPELAPMVWDNAIRS